MSARKTRTLPACMDVRAVWRLRLYVAGATPRATCTLANLKDICERHLPGRYQLRVIDVSKRPNQARANQIVATPTLIRTFPKPVCVLCGDLSNRPRALAALNLSAAQPP
jgi:circadian clock protein KaiB